MKLTDRDIEIIRLKELIVKKKKQIEELKNLITKTVSGLAVKDTITAIRQDIREVRREINRINIR